MSGAQDRLLAVYPSGAGRLVALVHRQPLLLLATAGFAGVLCDSGWNRFGLDRWVLVAVATLVTAVLLPRQFRWLAIVALFVPLFAIRHRQNDRAFDSASILKVVDDRSRPTVIEGTIDAPVNLRRHPLAGQRTRPGIENEWQSQIELSLRRIRQGHQFQPSSGRVLIVCDGNLDHLRPGDSIRVFGSIRKFLPPTNPGQRDLRDFYRRRHLHARVQVTERSQIEMIGKPAAPPGRVIASIAASSRDILLARTSESTGPLAVALVIGQRDFVDTETRDLLLVTGTAHLLSVSGLHLAIVMVLARWLVMAFPLPISLKILCVISVCLLYTVITGARPPVVRAAVLVVAMSMATWIRRPSQPLNTLALAALLLVAYNPDYVFSVGVQLSFLAVATLLICGLPDRQGPAAITEAVQQEQRLQSIVESSSSWPVRISRFCLSSVAQMFRFSLCVTAVSMPLVWHQFHVVSPISVITNVLLWPLLFVSLSLGVTTVTCGWIYEPLSIIPGQLCDQGLRAMRWVIETSASVPLGHFWLPAPPAWLVVLFYLVLVCSLWWPTGKFALRLRRGWIVGWVLTAYLVANHPAPLPEGTVEATFVDVGHGTSVVLRFDEDDVWLYDCGRLGNDAGSSRDIDQVLWELGVTNLQGIFLSHADADHYNALPGVLRRFRTRQILTPPGMLAEAEQALAAARAAIDDAGVAVNEISETDRLTLGNCTITVLHPPATRVPGSDNANSLVLQIDHQSRALVLPGDLEPPGTQKLIRHRRPPPGGVLMAPHHGSVTMQSESVLQWSRPRDTIVSGGQRAQRPEVEEMLAVTGSAVHVTARKGAIRVRIDPQGEVEVRSWRESPW